MQPKANVGGTHTNKKNEQRRKEEYTSVIWYKTRLKRHGKDTTLDDLKIMDYGSRSKFLGEVFAGKNSATPVHVLCVVF